MKISIDFDGTMWQHMAFFRELMKAMQAKGHSVGVLTGHDADTEERDVALMVSRGFPRPDFYLGRRPAYLPFNGAKFKIDMIILYSIDIHFDDFDFDCAETTKLFDESSVRDRVVKVQWKTPADTHYE